MLQAPNNIFYSKLNSEKKTDFPEGTIKTGWSPAKNENKRIKSKWYSVGNKILLKIELLTIKLEKRSVSSLKKLSLEFLQKQDCICGNDFVDKKKKLLKIDQRRWKMTLWPDLKVSDNKPIISIYKFWRQTSDNRVWHHFRRQTQMSNPASTAKPIFFS